VHDLRVTEGLVERWHWAGGTGGRDTAVQVLRHRVACQQRDEHLRVGAAPAGDRIPAGCRLVAGDRLGRELRGVVSLGDVVEGLVVAGAAGDLVDGRVDETQVPPGVLVGQGDQRGPDRGAGAGAATVAARRTYASYPEFLAGTNPSDLLVLPSLNGPDPGLVHELARLPHVRSAEAGEQLTAATLTPSGGIGTILVTQVELIASPCTPRPAPLPLVGLRPSPTRRACSRLM
jgi:hypothetical protein